MKTAKSQRELAIAVGKSQPAVNKWLKHPRWTLSKTGPWDIAEVQAWAARTLGLNQGAPAPKPSAPAKASPTRTPAAADVADQAPEQLDVRLRTDLYLKTQRAKLLAFELRQLENEFVPRAEVERDRIVRIQAVKASLERMPSRLAPQLAGMTDQTKIETVIEAEVIKILHAFSRESSDASN